MLGCPECGKPFVRASYPEAPPEPSCDCFLEDWEYTYAWQEKYMKLKDTVVVEEQK